MAHIRPADETVCMQGVDGSEGTDVGSFGQALKSRSRCIVRKVPAAPQERRIFLTFFRPSTVSEMPVYAVLIVTRNRPRELALTLECISYQDVDASLHLLVVDASDDAPAERNRASVSGCGIGNVRYERYPGTPSTARQRNFGLDRLPANADIVFFVDDDVTFSDGAMQMLAHALEEDPQLGAVGGITVSPDGSAAAHATRHLWIQRLFLLNHPLPGRLLASGCTSPANAVNPASRTDTHWLSHFAIALRADVAGAYRCDERLEGYALHEDLDYTYRVGREWRIAVEPKARIVHRVSEDNRPDPMEYARTRFLHRYWMVEKNVRTPLKRGAFWWATLGRYGALLLSRHPAAKQMRKGIRQGIGLLLTRRYPLLTEPEQTDG